MASIFGWRQTGVGRSWLRWARHFRAGRIRLERRPRGRLICQLVVPGARWSHGRRGRRLSFEGKGLNVTRRHNRWVLPRNHRGRLIVQQNRRGPLKNLSAWQRELGVDIRRGRPAIGVTIREPITRHADGCVGRIICKQKRGLAVGRRLSYGWLEAWRTRSA